jgi:uncharacterized metal-binding protein
MNQQSIKCEIPAASKTASEGDKRVIRLNGCTLHEVFRDGQWVCMIAE